MTTITQIADLQLGEDHQITLNWLVSLQITTWTIVQEADLIVSLEAWHINSVHAPLNRDDSSL